MMSFAAIRHPAISAWLTGSRHGERSRLIAMELSLSFPVTIVTGSPLPPKQVESNRCPDGGSTNVIIDMAASIVSSDER